MAVDPVERTSTRCARVSRSGDEGEDRVVAGYGEANFRRLARLKADLDPDNVFNRWHSVRPARKGNPLAGV